MMAGRGRGQMGKGRRRSVAGQEGGQGCECGWLERCRDSRLASRAGRQASR